jgi:hypothetical protein
LRVKWLLPMHSRASLAAIGINSVKAASVDPKRRVMWSARKDPKASAASSGTVITVSPLAQEIFALERLSWGNRAHFVLPQVRPPRTRPDTAKPPHEENKPAALRPWGRSQTEITRNTPAGQLILNATVRSQCDAHHRNSLFQSYGHRWA